MSFGTLRGNYLGSRSVEVGAEWTPPGTELLSQDAVFGLEVVDDVLLTAVHPSGHDREEELKVWVAHADESRVGRR